MSNVSHLQRLISERPAPPTLAGVALRHYEGPADAAVWLELRARAFAREKVGVRGWTMADFEREFLAKDWWSPERMWFAETAPGGQASHAVGTVTLALRGAGEGARPVVHWLAVLPSWRRRGVGSLLLATLETACWDAGYRGVWLETHADWLAARQFYTARGYQPENV